MKKGFSDAVIKFFSPEQRQPFWFLLMLYVAAVSTSGFYEFLSKWFSPLVLAIVGFAIIILLIFLCPVPQLLKYYYDKIAKNGFFSTRIIEKKRYKGMIVFASVGSNPSAANAIRGHIDSLEKCWVIAGDEDAKNGSLANALSLKDVLKTELEKKPDGGRDFFEIKKLIGDETDNPSAVYDMVEDIFSNLPEGMEETDVIADYTGGKKSMSAGMVLACARPSRDLQILKPNKYTPNGTADKEFGEYPLFIDIQFKVKKRSR